MKENKDPQPQVETPFGAILKQRRILDDALYSMNGFDQETKEVKLYIAGQINALDFVIRIMQ